MCICRWFPRCMFLLQNKGIHYVELVQKNKEGDIEQDNARSLFNNNGICNTIISSDVAVDLQGVAASETLNPDSNNGVCYHDYEYILSCTAAQSVEYSGFHSDQIVRAVYEWVCENTNRDVEELSASDLMEILIDQNDDIHSSQYILKDNRVISKCNTEVFATPRNDNRSVQSNTNVSELDEYIEQHAIAKEDELCSVCKEEPKQIALLPCGDIVSCRLCSMALYDCPECHQRVKATVRVYFS